MKFNVPNDEKKDDRIFVKWTLIGDGNVVYQGGMDSKNQYDGKGILVVPNMQIVIGYWKENDLHGKFTSLLGDGTKC